tara:strand:- start:12522 stop:12920 length:399 start_codon:yes stop_codon:yes gene_type:complete
MKTRVSRSFKDINLSFKPHPITKDITVIKDANAIKRSVRNLVETMPRERFFASNLGTDIRGSLFDFCDFGTASVIQKQIITTIENYEPRVDNLNVEVFPRPDNNEFEVNIFFEIIGQQFPAQAFQFILESSR